MKKNYSNLFVAFTIVSTNLLAQTPTNTTISGLPARGTALNDKYEISNNHSAPVNQVKPTVFGKTETAVDTVGFEFEDDQQTQFFAVSGSSKIPLLGTNPFYDEEFAQVYPYWGSGMDVETVLLKFWGKSSNTGSVDVKVYSVLGGDPSTAISTEALSLADVDTSGAGSQSMATAYTVVDFANPATVTGEFAVAVNFYGMLNSGGTAWAKLLAIGMTLQDEPHSSYNARIKTDPTSASAGEWVNLLEWSVLNGITYSGSGESPSNSNFLMFPVVSATYNTGINETEEINGIKLTQSYPNPTKDFAKIEYQIAESAIVAIELVDATGKTVLAQQEGKKAAGQYQVTLDVSQLPAGNYFYTLTAGSKRLAKKITIE